MPNAKRIETEEERRERLEKQKAERKRKEEERKRTEEEYMAKCMRDAEEKEKRERAERAKAFNALKRTAIDPDKDAIFALYDTEEKAYFIPRHTGNGIEFAFGTLGAARQCGALYDYNTAKAIKKHFDNDLIFRAVYIYRDGEEAPAEE